MMAMKFAYKTNCKIVCMILLIVFLQRVIFSQTVKYNDFQGLLFVDAKINDKVVARFLIDTGADKTVVTKALFAKLNTTIETSPQSPDAQIEYAATVAKFAIGDVVSANTTIHSPNAQLNGWSKDAPQYPIDGILGMDFLSRFGLGVDTLHKTLTFWPKGHLTKQQKGFWFKHRPVFLPTSKLIWKPMNKKEGAESIQFHRETEIPLHLTAKTAPYYSVSAHIDDVPVELIVDLGTNYTEISAQKAQAIKPQYIIGKAIVYTGDPETEGEAIREWVHSISFGQVKIEYPMIAIPGGPQEYNADGILGIVTLNQSRFILDFPAKSLTIAHYERPLIVQSARLGIFYEKMNEKTLRLHIAPSSAAAKAGLRDEDIPTDIEHKPRKKSRRRKSLWKITVKRQGASKLLVFKVKE